MENISKRIKKLSRLYYFITAVTSFISALNTPISVVYLLNLGVSLITIGYLTTIILLVSISTYSLIGFLADRYSKKKIFIIGILISVISKALMIFASNIYALYISYILAGLVISTTSGVIQSWFINTKNIIDPNYKDESLIFSKNMAISNIVIFVGIVTSAIIVIFLPFSSIYIISSTFMFIYGIICYITIPESTLIKNDSKFNLSTKERIYRYTIFLRNINFIKSALFYATLGFVYTGYSIIWMPSLLQVFGKNYKSNFIINESVIYALVYFVSGMFVLYTAKKVNVLFSNLYHQAFLFRIIFAISIGIAGLGQYFNIPILYILSILIMYTTGYMEYGPLTQINNSFFESSNRSFGLSTIFTIDSIASIIGGISISYISYNFGFSIAFYTISIVAFISAFLFFNNK